ncbi:MAG: thioredoxin-dependent thiol peroxidase [Acidimicrobiales bacterium]
MSRLEVGQTAPLFSLADQDQNLVKLSDFAGNRVVVYFYPADDTPGCTKEACQFNDNLADFGVAGVPVIGISPDDSVSHAEFRDKFSLGFPLLSDPSHQTMQAYGAWGEKTLYGRKSIGVIRSTFIVDETGRIARSWYNVRADGHAAKVLAELQGP